MTLSADAGSPPAGRASLSRVWSALGVVFWVTIPVLSILAVVGYFAASVTLGTTPPFAVVSGQSMRPAHSPGDLVVIQGAPTREIEVGDVVAILVPRDFVEERGFPSEVVHRVIEVGGSEGLVEFRTQGDNNAEADPFRVFPDNIRGKVIAHYPGLGYPVLFFRAQQGLIFLAALGAVVVGYFVIAAIERREETAQVESPRTALAALAEETRDTAGRLEELVGAVSDYGEHLRSHTQILQSMSAASVSLAAVTNQLGRTIGAPQPTQHRGDLLDELRRDAYAEWSLFVPGRTAAALGQRPADVVAGLVRLAATGWLEIRAVRTPELYRYRLVVPDAGTTDTAPR